MISPESIQSVRDQLKIHEVIGERVKLQRRGRSLIGLCPFHKEKSPSFHVNEERGFYYCFGCHASGDAIKFLQEVEGLSFTEAIRELAERSGITLVETRSDQDRKQDDDVRRKRDELHAVSQAAASYFETCLIEHPLAAYAHVELQRRGLTINSSDPQQLEALRAFRIGYAPAGWDGLAVHLRQAGLSLAAAEKVGLVAARRSGGGYYDRFRHRLMFAVLDLTGKVCAFSGRMLDPPNPSERQSHGLPEPTADERVAKYINSPESPIYRKRETVFGLYQARAAVRDRADCLVVEGNFDVVSLFARGIKHVVAPLGTAFTEEQANLIRRYSPNVTLLFDGDAAGIRAAKASREPSRAAGLSVRVASLPEGADPDTLVRERGPESLLQCVKGAVGMLEYLIETSLNGLSNADPQTQGNKVKEVLELIGTEEDPTTRALAQAHADRIAARLGVRDVSTLQALQRAVQRATSTRPSAPSPRALPPETARSHQRRTAVEEEVFGALVEYPQLMTEPSIIPLLSHATGELALALATLGQVEHDLAPHVDLLQHPFKRVALERLAAPRCSTLEVAHEMVTSNFNKLALVESKLKKAELIEALRQAQRSGDVDRELQLLAELKPLGTMRR